MADMVMAMVTAKAMVVTAMVTEQESTMVRVTEQDMAMATVTLTKILKIKNKRSLNHNILCGVNENFTPLFYALV